MFTAFPYYWLLITLAQHLSHVVYLALWPSDTFLLLNSWSEIHVQHSAFCLHLNFFLLSIIICQHSLPLHSPDVMKNMYVHLRIEHTCSKHGHRPVLNKCQSSKCHFSIHYLNPFVIFNILFRSIFKSPFLSIRIFEIMGLTC